jgi:hypothetical protein
MAFCYKATDQNNPYPACTAGRGIYSDFLFFFQA